LQVQGGKSFVEFVLQEIYRMYVRNSTSALVVLCVLNLSGVLGTAPIHASSERADLWTPLCRDHLDVDKILVLVADPAVDVNYYPPDIPGHAPRLPPVICVLERSSTSDSLRILKALVGREDLDPNARNPNSIPGYSALSYATSYQKLESHALELLKHPKTDPEVGSFVQCWGRASPLFISIYRHQDALLRALLKHPKTSLDLYGYNGCGSDPKFRFFGENVSPLMALVIARPENFWELLELFKERSDFNPHMKSKDYNVTPLAVAAAVGSDSQFLAKLAEMFEFDVNEVILNYPAPQLPGRTAIFWATPENLDFFLQAPGIDPNVVWSNHGQLHTPLSWFLWNGVDEIASRLLDIPQVDVHLPPNDSMVLKAAGGAAVETLKKLLVDSRITALDINFSEGVALQSALRMLVEEQSEAKKQRYREIASLLIGEARFDINQGSSIRISATVLYYAPIEIVSQMVQRADLEITPEDFVKAMPHPQTNDLARLNKAFQLTLNKFPEAMSSDCYVSLGDIHYQIGDKLAYLETFKILALASAQKIPAECAKIIEGKTITTYPLHNFLIGVQRLDFLKVFLQQYGGTFDVIENNRRQDSRRKHR
jgi:hypothetical protein